MSNADFTPRRRAMLAFALKVAERSGEIDEEDYAVLRSRRFDDEGASGTSATARGFSACRTGWRT